MSQTVRAYLDSVLEKLAQECDQAIGQQVEVKATSGGSGYRFVVPNASGKENIAWGACRTRHSRVRGKHRPCAIVYLDACLLCYKDPDYIKYYCDGQYGQRDRGQVEIAICQIGDADYSLALRALIEAARNLLSGTRYAW